MKYRLRAETLFLALALSSVDLQAGDIFVDLMLQHILLKAVNLIDRHMTALPVLRRPSAEHRFTCHAVLVQRSSAMFRL